MLEFLRFMNPPTMEKPPGYSHVVEIKGDARIVFFAGQLGVARGLSLETAGRLGSLAAAEIISHIGARPERRLAELARAKELLT